MWLSNGSYIFGQSVKNEAYRRHIFSADGPQKRLYIPPCVNHFFTPNASKSFRTGVSFAASHLLIASVVQFSSCVCVFCVFVFLFFVFVFSFSSLVFFSFSFLFCRLVFRLLSFVFWQSSFRAPSPVFRLLFFVLCLVSSVFRLVSTLSFSFCLLFFCFKAFRFPSSVVYHLYVFFFFFVVLLLF